MKASNCLIVCLVVVMVTWSHPAILAAQQPVPQIDAPSSQVPAMPARSDKRQPDAKAADQFNRFMSARNFMGGQKSATCKGTIKPDIAIIEGSIAQSGDQPSVISQGLDKQVGELRNSLTSYKAEVTALGIIRGLKRTRPQFGADDVESAKTPYLFRQPLEISLRDFTKIDTLIEKLPTHFTMGDAKNSGYDNKAFVTYRIDDPIAQLKVLTQECFRDYLEKECANSSADINTCKDGWKLNGYNLHSAQVPGAQGYAVSLHYGEGMGWGGTERDLDLASGEPVALTGNIMVSSTKNCGVDGPNDAEKGC